MGAQDSESIQSLRARTDNSVNMFSDRKTVRKGDTEAATVKMIFMVVTREMLGSGGGG